MDPNDSNIKYYKWNVSSLGDPIRLHSGYTDKTYFKNKTESFSNNKTDKIAE
jgi:hypothetical protein